MNLILASQSPQRKALLEQLGVPFTVQPAHIDESSLKNEAPLAYVKRIAIAKASAVGKANPGSIVIAADTPVIVGRRILQTPQNEAEAESMLLLQSGRRVSIPTVVAVADATGKIHVKSTESWVKIKKLAKADIDSYIAAGYWRGSAGALKTEFVQHWILTTHGSITGIIGLPLYETSILLVRAGIKVQPFA